MTGRCCVEDCGDPNCRVCWWGRQAQPETLLAKRARLEKAAREKRLGLKTRRG